MIRTDSKISVVVLTYNASEYLDTLLDSLNEQTRAFELFVIDSSSSDSSQEILKTRNVRHVVIAQSEFNHGGTRNLALNYISGDIVVYLTQDALPADKHAIERIVAPMLLDETIAIAYGKQLPYPNSTILSAFARSANYPDVSQMKNLSLVTQLGLKTCHLSNSFAAYKINKLEEFGLFPEHCIMCEDVYLGAKAVLGGYTIHYNAEARVLHSHNYSLLEEFKRYFDIGVFYHHEKWILESFSKAEKEGVKYVKAEIRHLINSGSKRFIPEMLLRTSLKYAGYLLGKHEEKIPLLLKKALSMHRYHWK